MQDLPTDYEVRTGAEKRALLWERLEATRYAEGRLPRREPGLLARLPLFRGVYHHATFLHVSDALPAGRVKLLHRYGAVAQAELVVTSRHPFTGLLATGGVGLLRLSVATARPSFSPALALKLFVDGRPSANLLAMPSADGQGRDQNLFARPYSNALPQPTTFGARLVNRAFQAAVEAMRAERLYPVYLPLHELASVGADGQAVAAPVVPDRLVLAPASGLRTASGSDWREQLAGLPEGTRLFEVAASPAIDEPAAPLGAVVLRSRFVASSFGDERLFFRHDTGPRTPEATS